jgi:type I restriction enzyme R subunit
MVKHAADEQEPLYTAEERVKNAFAKLTTGKSFTTEQNQWVDRIREHMIANLSIDKDDFEVIPIFTQYGGWGRANRVFDNHLEDMLHDLNEAIAA